MGLGYLFDRAEGFVARLRLALYSMEELVLPPFTSRVLKHVASIDPGLSFIMRIYEERRIFRPVTFSPLYVDGRALYKVEGDGSGPLVMRPGRVYHGFISIVSRDYRVVDSLALYSGGRLRTRYGGLVVEPLEVSVENLRGLSLGVDRFFKIRFLTPVVLTSKLMAPPSLGGRRIIKKTPERHKLFPSSSYIMASAARLWVALALGDDPRGSWIPYKIGRLADIMIVEVDHSVKPVTAVYGKTSDKEKLRLVRGITGWAVYEILNPRIKVFVDRMLALASRMGLGRSRSIGFGQINTIPLSRASEK